MSSPKPSPDAAKPSPDAAKPRRKHRAKPKDGAPPPAPPKSAPAPLPTPTKRSHKKKPAPAPVLPPQEPSAPQAPPSAPLAPLGPPPPSVVGPPEDYKPGAPWIPWEEVKSHFLLPTVTPDGSSARWPTLVELAQRFGIHPQTVKDRSAAEGWRELQREAEDAWWAAHNDGIQRELRQRYASVRRAAFVGGGLAITKAVGILNGAPDSMGILRATTSLKTGLETAAKAAGVDTPSQGAVLGVGVQVVSSGKDADGGDAPASVSLWAVLTHARRTEAPASDPFDHPSPLPASLASDR